MGDQVWEPDKPLVAYKIGNHKDQIESQQNWCEAIVRKNEQLFERLLRSRLQIVVEKEDGLAPQLHGSTLC